ncbi:putative glycoside hydrolase [Mariniflexile ostreae]|uniref:Glycoside hydrolase n=1 Tax=Mariniflexile ostreae TaxID=1520892 RepID=A0ABV5FCY9_9FLAO
MKIQTFKCNTKEQITKIVILFIIFLSLSFSANVVAQESQKEAGNAIYVTSDGSPFKSKAYFPKFSWKTTPMYYHFGDIDSVLKPEETKFIAQRTNFISMEKSHGFNLLGDAVLGTKQEVEAFHKVKPGIKVLFYYNSFVAWPFTRFNKDLTPEGVASKKETTKFLVNHPKTGKLMEKTNGPAFTYYFDYLNPDFRKWWVEQAFEGVAVSGADGIFIDRMNPTGQSGYFPDKDPEIRRAKAEMMAALKEKLGPNKIIIGNNAADNAAVFPFCDAFMFEHANPTRLTKENLLKEWNDMLMVAKAGKMSIYRFGAKGKGKTDITIGAINTDGIEQKSKDQLEYYLACYLIGAQPYSYFQWNWGWNLEDGNLIDYPELNKPLGSPKEAFKRVNPKGWVFTREFEHASVWLDTETRKAKITWK